MSKIITKVTIECSKCNGTGNVYDYNAMNSGYEHRSPTKICPFCNGSGKKDIFKVIRHGGRRTDKNRVVYKGIDLTKAKRIFDDLVLNARQGTIVLCQNDEIIRRECYGRNRTKW